MDSLPLHSFTPLTKMIYFSLIVDIFVKECDQQEGPSQDCKELFKVIFQIIFSFVQIVSPRFYHLQKVMTRRLLLPQISCMTHLQVLYVIMDLIRCSHCQFQSHHHEQMQLGTHLLGAQEQLWGVDAIMNICSYSQTLHQIHVALTPFDQLNFNCTFQLIPDLFRSCTFLHVHPVHGVQWQFSRQHTQSSILNVHQQYYSNFKMKTTCWPVHFFQQMETYLLQVFWVVFVTRMNEPLEELQLEPHLDHFYLRVKMLQHLSLVDYVLEQELSRITSDSSCSDHKSTTDSFYIKIFALLVFILDQVYAWEEQVDPQQLSVAFRRSF